MGKPPRTLVLLLSLLKPNMRAVWGLIFMALFVKGARTDPMPLKLQVKVLSKENQKDYRTSDLVPGFGRRRHHGPCLPQESLALNEDKRTIVAEGLSVGERQTQQSTSM